MLYEFLTPVIDFVYGIAERLGIISEPPEEVSDVLVNTIYNGVLAQAQKMSEITTIEQAVTFLGSLAAQYPEIVDHIDFDELATHYCNIVKMPPRRYCAHTRPCWSCASSGKRRRTTRLVSSSSTVLPKVQRRYPRSIPAAITQ